MQRVRGTIKTGEAVWVRLVGLTADVSERLRVFVENPPAGVEVDGVFWVLDEVMTSGKWCGSTRYTELIAKQLNTPPLHKLSMEFVSPTTFQVRGMAMPLPIPANVFGSLKNRWEMMTGATVADDLAAFIDYYVMLTQHEICTRIMRFKKRQPEVGFTGNVSYEIRRYSSYLQKQDSTLADRLENQYDDLSHWVGLLADFAFYGGVGSKTTQGMGMVSFP
jgi:CRISPR-associated endoribonuclease Cas6